MDERLWRRIDAVFHAALTRPSAERAAYLTDACAGDEELRRHVEQLLEEDARPTAAIDRPASDRATFLASGELRSGMQLGPYRVTGAIGRGGMGSVYRAEDTRLGRTVAIKLLRASVAGSDSMRQRFEREARAIAALNHPHICTVYDVGSEGGAAYLVMEFVEGETLAARLTRSALPWSEAVKVACQVADALAAAHAKGIVHRDLKPENIMLTATGAKVLDFGLAKTRAAAASTAELTLTAAGTVVGTAAYMSPEQACGKELDARTDVWSFGCVLYEMLSRRRVFDGESATDILAAILHCEPDWSAVPADVPDGLRALLERCLRKDPERRLRDLGDARIEMEDLLEQNRSPSRAVAAAPPARNRIVLWAAAALVLLVAGMLAIRGFRPAAKQPSERTVKFTIQPSQIRRGSVTDIDAEVSISADGTHIAYVESQGGQLWMRDIDQERAHPVPGAVNVYQAFWSPDNKWIGYSSGGSCGARAGCDLVKIPIQGGTPTVLLKLAGPFRRASWSSDGETIVYCDTTGMYTIPSRGGTPSQIMAHPHVEHPSFVDLPGGKRAVLYQAGGAKLPQHDIYLRVLGEKESRRVAASMSINPYPAYSVSGNILYVDEPGGETGIWALPFSLATLQPTGKAFPVAPRGSSLQLSRTDTLVYSDAPTRLLQLNWCDRTGKVVGTVGDPQRQRSPVLSPDGRRLAVHVDEGGPRIWVWDVERGTRTRITVGDTPEIPLGWTSSGSFSYLSPAAGSPEVFVRTLGSDRAPTQVSSAPGIKQAADWSPDERYVMYQAAADGGRADLWYRERKQDVLGDAVPFLKNGFLNANPRFSPDGRHVAYVSNETGKLEVFVREFPGGGNKLQVSANGGAQPRWRRDGREIFYLEGRKLMAAAVETRGTFNVGAPALVFENRSFEAGYDVAADGKRVLTLDHPPNEAPLAIHVVHNWFEEFRGKR